MAKQRLTKYSQFNNSQSSRMFLMVLLIDERPEDATDMQRTVKGEVWAQLLTSLRKDMSQ